ncbi:MAG: ribonuclease Z [Clostridia bacterium]|nr:ribonuclease Z [Clostridia bacterium]
MIDVCLLGSGGMMPLPGRWLSALVVRHNGKMILIDCGEGTQIPLKMLGWGFKAIETICFTHYHADHIAGLPGLLLSIGNSGKKEPLTLIGPPGLQEVVKGIMTIAPEVPFELHFEELPAGESQSLCAGDMELRSLPVDHSIPCLAYTMELKRKGKFDVQKAKKLSIPVEHWGLLQKGETVELPDRTLTPDMVLGEMRKGLKISYCTDTRPVEALAGFIRKSDLLVCEGMYGEDEKYLKAVEKKHMLFSEAAKLAVQSEAGEMWLTHYSPSLSEPEKYLDVARSIFPNTILGEDLLKKTLHF